MSRSDLPASVAARRHQVLFILVVAERAGYFYGARTANDVQRASYELLGEEYEDLNIQVALLWGHRELRWHFAVNGSIWEDFNGTK
jgi:hypothetical protein